MDQRPGPRDGGALVQRQRFRRDLFVAAGADRAGKARERGVAASCSEGRDMSSRSVRNISPYMPGCACAKAT